MRKILTSLLLGAFLAIPGAVWAGECNELIFVGQGEGRQICTLQAEYTINGVLFCEYSCELVVQ